ncbi:MAG: DUF2007 domain-containing protein [Myxococcales bacterium]|nr:MAG: DUF2007 domain-containing protein [Myxococcales bacterium]
MPISSTWVLLAKLSDLEQAELLASFLRAHDVQSYLPDQYTTSNLWLFSTALGGCRVMVHTEDLDQAKALMQSYQAGASSQSESSLETTSAEETPTRSASDDDAQRAFRSAVFGLLILPVVAHLYALFLCGRIVRRAEPFSSRTHFWLAVGISLFVLALVVRLLWLALS